MQEQEPGTIEFVNAALVPSNDGKAAIAVFSLFGGLSLSLSFPGPVVDQFVEKWLIMKKQHASIALLADRVRKAKV